MLGPYLGTLRTLLKQHGISTEFSTSPWVQALDALVHERGCANVNLSGVCSLLLISILVQTGHCCLNSLHAARFAFGSTTDKHTPSIHVLLTACLTLKHHRR